MLHFRFSPNFLAWGITLAFIVPAAAGDWPQWRGPKRDGISTETGLLKVWPSEGPPLAWKATGLGAGYSGVAVAQGRIFTMGDGPGSSSVHALDLNGKHIWTAKLGKTGGDYPGPRATPTIDGELAFALGQHGDLVCLEATTGKERWRKNLEKDFGGRVMSSWGYTESPLVDGDKLVCTPGGSKGTIVALDKKTGKTIWQSKDFTDAAAYASIISSDLGSKRQYVQLTGESVASVAADNGQLLWKAKRSGRTAVIATPVAWENYVYVTSGYGVGCNLFKVTVAGDEFKPEQVYANKVMANHHGGVVLVGNHIYGYSDGKGWVCQEPKTGNMIWEEKKKLGKGSLVYADGHLYLRSEDGKGTVVLVEATPAGYKEKGRFDQPGRSDQNSWPHPVIADGKLYLRDQDLLLCYNVKQK